jgi:hypothetical protein
VLAGPSHAIAIALVIATRRTTTTERSATPLPP